MGNVVLKFEPRSNLKDFANTKQVMSLLRCAAGRRSSRNMVIHGENLSTLAALRAGFGLSGRAVQVDVIYIDPPYNVGGNQGYKNVWKGRSEKERHWAGNHGEFLDFMEPRLKIGRQLLTDDGVMLVSICDGEYARLKILMDEIFGESNLIGTVIWDNQQGAPGSHLVVSHEYVLVYAKDRSKAPAFQTVKKSATLVSETALKLFTVHGYQAAYREFKEWFKLAVKEGTITAGEKLYNKIHPGDGRVFRADNSCAQDDPRGTRCRLALTHPVTKKKCPVPANGWKWNEAKLRALATANEFFVGDGYVVQGEFCYGKDETTVPCRIRYLDKQEIQRPKSIVACASDGKTELPDGVTFATPKSLKFLTQLLSWIPKRECIVLDYFAGSGSTAHAVERLNETDGGKRSWIMVEEMGSTFENVLLPRLKQSVGEFAIYTTESVSVGSKEIASFFTAYSQDFLSAYHNYDERAVVVSEGLSVLGIDQKSSQLVCMALPSMRKSANFFLKELSLLKAEIQKSKARSVIIYAVRSEDGADEPWRGNDKSILSGTSCNKLEIVELPRELVQKWADSLDALVA